MAFKVEVDPESKAHLPQLEEPTIEVPHVGHSQIVAQGLKKEQPPGESGPLFVGSFGQPLFDAREINCPLARSQSATKQPPPMELPLAAFFESKPPYAKCDKSIEEMEKSGATKITSITFNARFEKRLFVLQSGYYGIREDLAENSKMVILTDAPDIEIVCSVDPLPVITNE